MAMSYIWSGLVILSFLWGLFHGNLSSVAAAALDGAQSALELSLSMAGILCLWSGVMEILNVCGLSRRIAALFRPLLRRLLPTASRDEETLAAVSANVSANLLGLGNAATPLGIQAAGGWPETAVALPVTSCACWWCSTPPPFSFCPPPWPPSGLPSAVPPPSTFCPPSGSVLSPLSRWACSPPAFSPAGKEALHEPL